MDERISRALTAWGRKSTRPIPFLSDAFPLCTGDANPKPSHGHLCENYWATENPLKGLGGMRASERGVGLQTLSHSPKVLLPLNGTPKGPQEKLQRAYKTCRFVTRRRLPTAANCRRLAVGS